MNSNLIFMKQLLFISFIFLTGMQQACSQAEPVNWTEDQLEQPADLARKIDENKNIPVIINVGPGVIIPNSIDAGMASEPEGIQKFKEILSAYSKNSSIVIYCGCCPFDHCPNVRPAIDVLKQEGYTNFRLLNLPQNIRTDWIAKGYPTIKEQ